MKTGLILGISVLVAACGGQTGRQAAAGQDTATIAADSGMQVRYYEGTLPTADGTPINYELELKNEEFSGDGSYDLTMMRPCTSLISGIRPSNRLTSSITLTVWFC